METIKTTIPKERWGVHETHCCVVHGCKYGDSNCPIELGLTKQRFCCEMCEEDENELEHFMGDKHHRGMLVDSIEKYQENFTSEEKQRIINLAEKFKNESED